MKKYIIQYAKQAINLSSYQAINKQATKIYFYLYFPKRVLLLHCETYFSQNITSKRHAHRFPFVLFYNLFYDLFYSLFSKEDNINNLKFFVM